MSGYAIANARRSMTNISFALGLLAIPFVLVGLRGLSWRHPDAEAVRRLLLETQAAAWE